MNFEKALITSSPVKPRIGLSGLSPQALLSLKSLCLPKIGLACELDDQLRL